jgi:hypothetical protein
MSKIYGLTEKQAKRIADALNRFDKISTGSVEFSHGGKVDTTKVVKGKITKAVSFSTPGEAKLWYPPDPDSDSSTDAVAGASDYDPVPCWAWGIPKNTCWMKDQEVFLGLINGRWYVLGSCGFMAKLTSMDATTSTDPRYSWTEQIWTTNTTLPTLQNGTRTGTATGTDFARPFVPTKYCVINDIVWMEPTAHYKSTTSGGTTTLTANYYFSYPGRFASQVRLAKTLSDTDLGEAITTPVELTLWKRSHADGSLSADSKVAKVFNPGGLIKKNTLIPIWWHDNVWEAVNSSSMSGQLVYVNTAGTDPSTIAGKTFANPLDIPTDDKWIAVVSNLNDLTAFTIIQGMCGGLS